MDMGLEEQNAVIGESLTGHELKLVQRWRSTGVSYDDHISTRVVTGVEGL